MTQSPIEEHEEHEQPEEPEEEYDESQDDYEDLKQVERELEATHPVLAAIFARQKLRYLDVTVEPVPFELEVEFGRWLNIDSEDNQEWKDKLNKPMVPRPQKRRHESGAVPHALGSARSDNAPATIAVEDIPLPPPRKKWLSLEEQTRAVLAHLRNIYKPGEINELPPLSALANDERGIVRLRN